MIRLTALLLLSSTLAHESPAQLRAWPDSVVFYRQGPNATPGYDSTNPHFPSNVLGPPDSTATGTTPAFAPQELQALGTEGVIILKYAGRAIVNGPGPDFTVFENGFYPGGDTNNVFREVGVVSVSRDGITFTQFPYQGAPVWRNLAGATPTWGGNPLDPAVSGGDRFDLAEIGVDSIHFVKIVDAGPLVPDGGPSFDLDAIAALHLVSMATSVEEAGGIPAAFTLGQNYPNPCNPSTRIPYTLASESNVAVEVFNLLGGRVREVRAGRQRAGNHSILFDGTGLPSGVYFYRVTTDNGALTRRMTILQ